MKHFLASAIASIAININIQSADQTKPISNEKAPEQLSEQDFSTQYGFKKEDVHKIAQGYVEHVEQIIQFSPLYDLLNEKAIVQEESELLAFVCDPNFKIRKNWQKYCNKCSRDIDSIERDISKRNPDFTPEDALDAIKKTKDYFFTCVDPMIIALSKINAYEKEDSPKKSLSRFKKEQARCNRVKDAARTFATQEAQMNLSKDCRYLQSRVLEPAHITIKDDMVKFIEECANPKLKELKGIPQAQEGRTHLKKMKRDAGTVLMELDRIKKNTQQNS